MDYLQWVLFFHFKFKIFVSNLKLQYIIFTAKSDGKDRLTVTDTKPVHLSDENNEDDALAAMLDKDLQPPPPINNNPVSEEIHQQHIILTKKYLTLNERRVYANQRKAELLSGMDSIGKKNREEILKKRKEIVSFYGIFYRKLRKLCIEI